MHGTVKEVSARLTQLFEEDSQVAILIWTVQDVTDCGECMDITESEVHRVLGCIGEDSDPCRYGIGRDSVRDMLVNLREEDELAREVTVSAAALAQVLRVAGDYMRLEDAQGGEGAASRLWPKENEAIRAIMAAMEG